MLELWWSSQQGFLVNREVVFPAPTDDVRVLVWQKIRGYRDFEVYNSSKAGKLETLEIGFRIRTSASGLGSSRDGREKSSCVRRLRDVSSCLVSFIDFSVL